MPLDRRWDLSTEHQWLKEKVDRQWKEGPKNDERHSTFISMFVNSDSEYFFAYYLEDGELRIMMEGTSPMVTRKWDGISKLTPPYIMSVEERWWYQACMFVARKRKEAKNDSGS